ncbi:CCA tRNA nucleotidyltransferase [Granulicella sp. 5B5]|uniref:CCA tRNA nucleotidyltransferase n=1 Tax=Granulicella sp. 5B5 TaxID=1617967 RepID=UPI0015F4CE64|nr:CCA tRNA nucleotidyltransferase [Granulicella sp. 5B5]QMV17461.1 CCA tRNA nucleotidyltransferase [Granulicella sp. 5B5]
MADYIYLLQTRLNAAQLSALDHVRNAARARAMTVFLVGGAVRDLTSGAPVRDLDIAVQGNALKLKKDIEKVGGTLIGESEPTQALFFNFPGGVRLEVGSTLSATYPKPGKPVYKPANILDDLRRRGFTANAMAISLNDGSFGLLMDPLNGIADLENRELRLVSNYGFIEDPSLLIRATRFMARTGWQMEEKTRQRYETAKAEDYIAALNPFAKSYELEEIFHEEDPLRALQALEAEGWMKVLFPAWTSKHVNETELERLRDTVGQLDLMGIHPDPSAAFFGPLTAKLAPKDVTALKHAFARPGFVDQIAALEPDTKAFATLFTGKDAAAPSATWKLLYASAPEPILWLAHTSKAATIQNKFKAFFTDWPQAKSKVPYQLMQEMRITPDLPGYNDLLDKLFFAIMDNLLDTPEAARAFLEPYSPPAPPPPVNLRRRAVKRETKPAKRSKKAAAAKIEEVDILAEAAEANALPPTPPPAAEKIAPVKASTKAPAKAPAKAAKPVPAKAPAKVAAKAPVKAAPAKTPIKAAAKKAPAKPAPKKAAPKPAAKKPAPKPVAKKAPGKTAVKKAPARTPAKKAPAKPAPTKPAAKKPSKPTPKPAAKKKSHR